jgi:hypothetical protein
MEISQGREGQEKGRVGSMKKEPSPFGNLVLNLAFSIPVRAL